MIKMIKIQKGNKKIILEGIVNYTGLYNNIQKGYFKGLYNDDIAIIENYFDNGIDYILMDNILENNKGDDKNG